MSGSDWQTLDLDDLSDLTAEQQRELIDQLYDAGAELSDTVSADFGAELPDDFLQRLASLFGFDGGH